MKTKIGFIKRVALFAIAIILAVPAQSIYALSESQLDLFAANNIMFYDPEDCENDGGGAIVGGEAVVSGSTAAEKVWSGLKSMGLSDEVTAGIMGNMTHESNAFNPAQHEGSFKSRWENFDLGNDTSTSYGIGLIQWSYGRRTKVYNYVKEKSPGLIKYLDKPFTYSYENGSAYGCNGDCFIKKAASENEANALFSLELTYLINNELKVVKSYSPVLEKTTVYEAAKYFLEHVEIPKNPYIEYHQNRATDAQKFYDQFHGQTSFGAGNNGGASTSGIEGSKITIIGDSITDGAKSEFESEIPGVDIHSQVSKMFSGTNSSNKTGTQILEELSSSGQLREVLVFALGTNQNYVKQTDIDKVLSLASSASKIVFVTNHTTTDNYDNNNTLFKKAASDNPSKVVIADWQAVVRGNESQYLYSDGTHPNAEGNKKFVETIKNAIGGAVVGTSVDQCCDPADGSDGTAASFTAQKYQLSEGQMAGLLKIIKNENGGSINAVKFEASIMANLFEYKKPSATHDADGLVNYVRTSGWFSTSGLYDESYTGYSASEMEAVKDVWINGNRSIPPEIVEHDDIGDIGSIELDGKTVDKMDIKNWVKGKTVVKQDLNHNGTVSATWIFYEWANPDGTKISSSSGGGGTGDPFGYYPNNPPKGNSVSGAKSSACCDYTIGGVSYKTIGGVKYAFPIAGATQANYLNSSTFPGESVLSRIPCNNYSAGACHHDYHAVDMGIMMEMLTGKDPTAEDYGGEAGFSNMYYNSAGAQVVAITAGTVKYVSEYQNGVPADWHSKCAQIGLMGDDGNYYWMGHLDLASASVKGGEHVDAGTPLAKIGAPQCAQNTQSHLHIDVHNGERAAGKGEEWIVQLMDELWDALPGDGSTDTNASSCSEGGNGELKEGGMTEDEAKDLMKKYKELVLEYKGKSSFSMTAKNGETKSWTNHCTADGYDGVLKNCVSFTKWFVYTYVDIPKGFTIKGDGAQVVGNMKKDGFETGTQPRPYAVFSWSNAGYGHTGIVLKVNDDGTFIVGESSCSAGWNSEAIARAKKYKLSDHDWTFAYTDGKISF